MIDPQDDPFVAHLGPLLDKYAAGVQRDPHGDDKHTYSMLLILAKVAYLHPDVVNEAIELLQAQFEKEDSEVGH